MSMKNLQSEGNEILAVDLGFVQTKASSTSWETKFSSIVKPRSDVAIADMADSEGFTLCYEGKAFSVGAKGSYDFKADRLTRESDIAKLLAVFGQYQDKTGIRIVDTLVTGLPIIEFNAYKDQLREALQRTFQFTYGSQKKVISVQNVLVIPQSAGAFYNYILDIDGEPVDEALALEDVITFDIGGRTSDGCIMEASRYSQDSFTIMQGVWKAHDVLRKLIQRDFQYGLKPFEVDVVMRTGILKLGRDEHRVDELIYKAIASVYPEMRDELSLSVNDFRRFAAMILVGGGAHVFHDFLAEDINIPIIISENSMDSEFANARGYLKYAKLRAKQLQQSQ